MKFLSCYKRIEIREEHISKSVSWTSFKPLERHHKVELKL